MKLVYAIIECPNCGKDECNVRVYGSRGHNITGHDATHSAATKAFNYGVLKKRFDEGPVPCAKCGAKLHLIKPEE